MSETKASEYWIGINPTGNAELDAILLCEKALGNIAPGAKKRVLQYLLHKLSYVETDIFRRTIANIDTESEGESRK